MKKTIAVMCLVAAFAILTLPADAARRVNQSIPITLSVPVLCAGEVVDLSGTLRAKDNGAHLFVNTQQVAGTGEITGRRYQANGSIHMLLDMVFLNGASNVTMRTEFIKVTSAPGLDGSVVTFWLQGDLHLTFHGNGTETVKFDNVTVDCTGDGAGLWDY